jgi:hypothetical protein
METRPPEMIARFVRLLVPPAEREHVLGDLAERYESPARYLADAFKVLPFVVASRMRRTVNPGLSAFLAFFLWFGVFWGPQQRHWLVAAIPTLVGVMTLALRDAYRTLVPRWPHAAAGDVIAAAAAVLILQGVCALIAPGWMLTSESLRVGFPLGLVILFFVRWQSPSGIHQPLAFSRTMTMCELRGEINVFEGYVRRAIRIELGAVIFVVGCFTAALIAMPPSAPTLLKWAIALSICGALFVGAFLFRHARVRPISRTADFAATIALYRQELERRIRISKAYFWWYILPLSIGPMLLIGGRLERVAPLARIALAVGAFALIASLLVFAMRPMIKKTQTRLEQLASVSERL